MVENLRKYGNEPFNVAVIHGGPGAPGGMAPVARELSQICGVLEPLQTANAIEGQILELKDILENNADSPVILIGHSWGAWLSYIFAAQYPQLVKKLILVGSGSFEEKYLSTMKTNRTSRLIEDVFQNCMNEATYLRKSKKLLEMGSKIKCSVIAIHCEYDSHAFEEVEKPLSKVLKDF